MVVESDDSGKCGICKLSQLQNVEKADNPHALTPLHPNLDPSRSEDLALKRRARACFLQLAQINRRQ